MVGTFIIGRYHPVSYIMDASWNYVGAYIISIVTYLPNTRGHLTMDTLGSSRRSNCTSCYYTWKGSIHGDYETCFVDYYK